ncbi:MAG: acetolactate synthase small subunit [Campylobacteraceae bacterium]|jgi:acetolactate synthase-1/3 small subunit|nr:acetolactate synthase small subunit [Campylobacteraceae bacterium]
MIERRIISVEVVNEHGVLARIAGLFAGRGYNIETLTVAPMPGSNLSRVTIETSGNKKVLEQIVKQLHKLISTYKVIEHQEMVEREMALVKLPVSLSLADVEALASSYNGKIVDADEDSVILMISDEPKRIEGFLKAVKKFSPKEIVRGGIVAIEK